MELESLCTATIALERTECSMVEALVAEAALLPAEKSLAWLLLNGSLPNDIDVFPNLNETNKRFPLAGLNKVNEPDAENKDASETKDKDDDEDDDEEDDDQDDDEDDDDSEDESDDDDVDSDDDVEGNGNGGSDDEDDDNDDEDDDEDSDDGEDEEEDNEEEQAQPPSKKMK